MAQSNILEEANGIVRNCDRKRVIARLARCEPLPALVWLAQYVADPVFLAGDEESGAGEGESHKSE